MRSTWRASPVRSKDGLRPAMRRAAACPPWWPMYLFRQRGPLRSRVTPNIEDPSEERLAAVPLRARVSLLSTPVRSDVQLRETRGEPTLRRWTPGALAHFLAAERAKYLRRVRRWLPTEADAEDVVQRAMVRATERARSLKRPRARSGMVRPHPAPVGGRLLKSAPPRVERQRQRLGRRG
jgi:hypothetical protein